MELKNIQAIEFYNEYLELKESLLYLTGQVDYYKRYKMTGVLENIESQIVEKSDRLKYVLHQLELYGVSMKNLVLLACGLSV